MKNKMDTKDIFIDLLDHSSMHLHRVFTETRGWASKTYYDPSGSDFGGFGNLSGYTMEKVRAVPLFAEELLQYFDRVKSAICAYLMEYLEYLGENKTLKAIWSRIQKKK
jgi:hypothetical protein